MYEQILTHKISTFLQKILVTKIKEEIISLFNFTCRKSSKSKKNVDNCSKKFKNND